MAEGDFRYAASLFVRCNGIWTQRRFGLIVPETQQLPAIAMKPSFGIARAAFDGSI
jgi:hypothetical protein